MIETGVGKGASGKGRVADRGWLVAAGVACLLAAQVGCSVQTLNAGSDFQTVQCVVDRQECAQEQILPGATAVTCRNFDEGVTQVRATICALGATSDAARLDACRSQLCDRMNANPLVGYNYPFCSVISAAAPDPTLVPRVGTCRPAPAGTTLSSVDFIRHSRECTQPPGTIICDPLTPQDVASQPPPANCYDLTKLRAQLAAQPPSKDHDRAALVTRVVLNDSSCSVTQPFTSAFTLNTGTIGLASGAGNTIAINAVRSSVLLSRPCATCAFTRLERLRIDLANTTVAGAKVSNVVVTNSTPVTLQIPDPDDPTRTGIAPRNLSLTVVGMLNGVESVYQAENQTAWGVTASATTFHLTGSLNLLNVDASGRPLPVTISIDAVGIPASPQQAACANLSPRDRLFGFEDPQSWTSSQASLSLVTSPVRQGCGALGIRGHGYIPIEGAPFTASGLSLRPALSVDLFMPSDQPNPYYLGALQMYLTCPSVNAFSQYIGQVELTGKPQNRYSTLRFPLPSAVTATLQRAPADCFFSLALNVNDTGRTWILDNLRFTP